MKKWYQVQCENDLSIMLFCEKAEEDDGDNPYSLIADGTLIALNEKILNIVSIDE